MSEQIIHDLMYWVADRYTQERGAMHVETVVVHPGPKAWKTVSLLRFPDTATGEIRGLELRAQTWKAPPPGQRYDFEKSAYHWHCEGEHEIEALRLFLNHAFPAQGNYRLIPEGERVWAVGRRVGARPPASQRRRAVDTGREAQSRAGKAVGCLPQRRLACGGS